MSVRMIDYIVDEHNIEIDSDDLKRVKVSLVSFNIIIFYYFFPPTNSVRPILLSYSNSIGWTAKTECHAYFYL